MSTNSPRFLELEPILASAWVVGAAPVQKTGSASAESGWEQSAAAVSMAASLRTEPPRTGDAVQDAYLVAVAAHLAHRLRVRVPAWAEQKSRRLEQPWFALPDAWARATLLRDSPAAFRERNLFTTENALHRA